MNLKINEDNIINLLLYNKIIINYDICYRLINLYKESRKDKSVEYLLKLFYYICYIKKEKILKNIGLELKTKTIIDKTILNDFITNKSLNLNSILYLK